jgi:hypothetical protein
MKRITYIVFVLLKCVLIQANDTLNLAGQWSFDVDSQDRGIEEKWQIRVLSDAVQLPGSMASNGKGNLVTMDTKWTATNWSDSSWFLRPDFEKYRTYQKPKFSFWLTPVKEYVGPAWYSRTVEIPSSWKNSEVYLFLERCHWESRLWVNGVEAGMRNSLSTPHLFDISPFVKAGKNRLTIRVDNRIIDINPGLDAHSISDNTQTNWNGIIGGMYLISRPLVVVTAIKVYPDVALGNVRIEGTITNNTNEKRQEELLIDIESYNIAQKHVVPRLRKSLLLQKGSNEFSFTIPMGSDFNEWSEHSPAMYALNAMLDSSRKNSFSTTFGMRNIRTSGTRFLVNDKPVFLRGTLECAIFPLTGYPPTDVESWKKIMIQLKNFGLNHMRFHSWCPPKAAFIAADEHGVYLQVEAAAWATIGDGEPIDQFIYNESERIINEYGNHPSFVFMAYGNEPHGANHKEFLSEYLRFWKAKDDRRLYTSAAGWPELPENEFHNIPNPRIQHWNAGLGSSINANPPQTVNDYSGIIQSRTVPVVSHEIGQWCAYPNFDEIKKYTGVLRPLNFELFAEDLYDRNMGHQAKDFLMASGKLQVLCYKADIEAALRTKNMGGFQLLDLRDFPGQGTALVGVLDPFWEEKGYVTAEEYRQFCNEVVLLARLPKMTYSSSDTLVAELEMANFSAGILRSSGVKWELVDVRGKVVSSGLFPERDYEVGNGLPIGAVEIPLISLENPAKYTLRTSIVDTDFSNQWDTWLYPDVLPVLDSSTLVANKPDDEVFKHLESGGNVLLSVTREQLKPDKGGSVDFGFSSVFWNTSWTKNQAPHTLGILCDPEHPALAYFPTDFHSNWQWWDIIKNGAAMRIDHFPSDFQSIVQPIHTWFDNNKLSMIFEAKVLNGKIIVVSSDLFSDIDNRLAGRQLKYSLLKYSQSGNFNPVSKLKFEDIADLFK